MAMFTIEGRAADAILPIVDTHVHYSRDAWAAYPPAAVLKLFDQAGVRRAFVSSTPDDGTLRLYDRDSRRIVPILRPYRDGTDLSSWSSNQQVFEYVAKRIRRPIYRGIGEFHLQGRAESRSRQIRGVVGLAVARNIHLHVHADALPIRTLFELDPKLRILWAHAGMSEPAKTVGDMLDRYQNLWTEVSFRGGDIAPGGKMDPAWRALILRHPDRFMIGTDTYITPRWDDYVGLITEHRQWLGQLPKKIAEGIAFGNAIREFGLPPIAADGICGGSCGGFGGAGTLDQQRRRPAFPVVEMQGRSSGGAGRHPVRAWLVDGVAADV